MTGREASAPAGGTGDPGRTAAVARAACYKALSLAFLPPGPSLAAAWAALPRVTEALPPEHQAALGPLLSGAPTPPPAPEEHARVFGPTLAATPYESEYDPLAGARKGHRLADLQGFYHAFGFRIAPGQGEFPDHVATELEFMSVLLLKAAAAADDDARAVCDAAAARFLADHLAPWVPAFARRLRAVADGVSYRQAADLLEAFVAAEVRWLGIEAPAVVGGPAPDPGPLACPAAPVLTGAEAWPGPRGAGTEPPPNPGQDGGDSARGGSAPGTGP